MTHTSCFQNLLHGYSNKNHGIAINRPVAHQAPLSMGVSRQEYWSGLPIPSAVRLPHPVIEPGSPALQADSLPSESSGKPQRLLWGLLV